MKARRSDIHAGQSPVVLIRHAIRYAAEPMAESRRPEENVGYRVTISPSTLAVEIEIMTESCAVEEGPLPTRRLVSGRKSAFRSQIVGAGDVRCSAQCQDRALAAVHPISQPNQAVRQTLYTLGSINSRGVAGNQIQGKFVAEPVFERGVTGMLIVHRGRTRGLWKCSLYLAIPIRGEGLLDIGHCDGSFAGARQP